MRPSAQTPPHPSASRHPLVSLIPLAVFGCLVASGCSAPPTAPPAISANWTTHQPPADFAMTLTLTPQRTPPDRPLTLRAAQYVLEPDGTLRAGIGPGTHANFMPPVTARLDPDEIEQLWQATQPVLAEPSQADPDAADVAARLRWTAHGRTRDLTLPASPPHATAEIHRLLHRLGELRGDPVNQADPANP